MLNFIAGFLEGIGYAISFGWKVIGILFVITMIAGCPFVALPVLVVLFFHWRRAWI